MSDTAQAERGGLSEAGKITRYFVIGGVLLILAASSALVLWDWLPNYLPSDFAGVHPYIAGICGFYGLVFVLAGILGGPAAPREYFGGAALTAVAIFAYVAAQDLSGMRGFAFGPGTAPRLFAYVLGALGIVVSITGVFTKGPAIERFHIRGPIFVSLSVLVFALTVRSFGLAISSFLSICAAAAATPDARIVETVVWAVVLTAFCCFLFPYALNLPMQLWPVSYDPVVLIKGISFR